MTKALVIGGGVGGLVTAAALKRAGLDPVVYEAHPSPVGGVDSFLTLAPNGLAALRTVGMLERVRAAARFTTTRIEFVNGSGRRLGLLGDEAHLPPELRSVSISRAALQLVVTEYAIELGIAVEYDKRLTNYTESASGVVAEFIDGTTATGEFLVGADGPHSAVRRAMSPEAPETSDTGRLLIGGYSAALDLPPTPDETMRIVMGERASFEYQTAPNGDTFWFAVLGDSELSPEEMTAYGDDVWKENALDLFRDGLPEITEIMRAADRGEFRPHKTYVLTSLPHVFQGRVGLVGDAVCPASGQGASLAVEDALELARCLHDHEEVPAALAAYQHARQDRLDSVTVAGRQHAGRKSGSSGPVALMLRDLALRVVFTLMRRFGSRGWPIDQHGQLGPGSPEHPGNRR